MNPATGHRRPGRPRSVGTASDLEPREEILRHAAALFSSRGVSATRLADIAAAVGVSPPALYYHFDNLDEIVEHLLQYVVEESAAFATAAATGEGRCADRLWSLVEHHVARLTSGPYDLWFVVGLSDAESSRFAGVAEHASRWRRAVGRLVDEGQALGEFGPLDRALAVAAVSGLVYGSLELRHRGRDVDPSAVADLAVATLAPRART